MDCQALSAQIVVANAEYQTALAQQQVANAAKTAADNAVMQKMMNLQYLNYLWQTYCASA